MTQNEIEILKNEKTAKLVRLQADAYVDGGDDMCKIMLQMMDVMERDGYKNIEIKAMRLLITRARKNNREFSIEDYAQMIASGAKPN